ncbi:LOW QUALITY PROTEIN: hypothetical protein U9M48_002765 [Paspalum notatum var. saurae]|uniref:Uncharacterized protein n=1 Tax=Paspalum notatum var. saurae TaxID=547442 RepID=A0AAQ3PPS9_PASNO
MGVPGRPSYIRGGSLTNVYVNHVINLHPPNLPIKDGLVYGPEDREPSPFFFTAIHREPLTYRRREPRPSLMTEIKLPEDGGSGSDATAGGAVAAAPCVNARVGAERPRSRWVGWGEPPAAGRGARWPLPPGEGSAPPREGTHTAGGRDPRHRRKESHRWWVWWELLRPEVGGGASRCHQGRGARRRGKEVALPVGEKPRRRWGSLAARDGRRREPPGRAVALPPLHLLRGRGRELDYR